MTYYTADHDWLTLDGDIATIGITAHAAHALGDLVFVELPAVGAALAKGEVAATVESVKAASEIYAPVGGEIVAVNAALGDTPELVNSAPEAGGWLFQLKLSDPAELDALLAAEPVE